MQNDYGSHGFSAIAINLNEDMENVVKVWARQNTNLYLRDNGSVWAIYRQNNYIPLNYVVDTAGIVRFWQEGFNEDYIRQLIEQYLPDPIDHDVGVTRLVAPAGAIDSGRAVVPACTVYNYRANTETYQVRLRIGSRYNETVTVTGHAPYTARRVEFPQWTALERGAITATCSTELAGDDIPGNDARRNSLTVNVFDLAVLAIIAPADTVDSAAAIQPQVLVANLGTMSDFARVRLWIGDFYSDSVNVALQPGDTGTARLRNWTPQQLGTFPLRCSVSGIRGEMVPANNVAWRSVHVRASGIAEPAPSGFVNRVFEARPSPHGRGAVFSFNLATPGPASIAVYSPTGELVRTLLCGQQPAGRHEVIWDGRDNSGRQVGSGAWLVQFRSGEQRLTRKFTLSH